MSSGQDGDLWFLQPTGKDTHHINQQSPPPHSYQSSNAFNDVIQSQSPQDGYVHPPPPPEYAEYAHSQYSPPEGPPPQQGPPYPQQQGGPFAPPQLPSQQGTPQLQQQASPYLQQVHSPPQQQGFYSPQQNLYAQPGPYTPPQQGYPQQHGSPYPQQGYPQQSQSSQAGGEASSFYNLAPPRPIPGPGGPDQPGFFDNAMQMAGVQEPPPGPDGSERGWFSSSKNPLDPPPRMFKRPAPGHYSYVNFRPMSVLAQSERLQDGFALTPPVHDPGALHPFISHDITEDDWHKFLKDFQKTAHLSPSDRLFQSMANSFMKDKISSAKVQKRMAENKLEPIGDYLMAWNHYFFRPRRMTVVLAKGSDRFSGESDDYPPDIGRHSKKEKKEKKSSHHNKTRSTHLPTPTQPYPPGSLLGGLLNPVHRAVHETTMAVATAPHQLLLGTEPGGPSPRSRAQDDSDDSDSSSSSSESDDRGSKRRERKIERERRRQERRARREERRGTHGKTNQVAVGTTFPNKFRLVVCYWDGQGEVY